MGVAGIIINACLDIKETKEPNLRLMKEKKDGLNVYTPIVKIYNANEIACPVCRYGFNENERKEILYLLRNGNNKIIYLFYQYRNLILDSEIDIFDKLEKKYHEIELAQKDFHKYRYYKHCCLKNDKEIQNIFYIDFTGFDLSKVEYYHPSIMIDSRYYYNNWKNNPKLRDILLKERKEELERWENCELPDGDEGDWSCSS